jgi:Ca-activated chloride channel family protein
MRRGIDPAKVQKHRIGADRSRFVLFCPCFLKRLKLLTPWTVYTFPIDPRAAITGFDIEVADRKLRGEVKRKDQAAATYDDAISAGQGAYLLEQQTDEIFRLSIGNLEPAMEVTVNIHYVTELQNEDDGVRFMLPTTIAPKYTPEQIKSTSGPVAGAAADETPSVSVRG